MGFKSFENKFVEPQSERRAGCPELRGGYSVKDPVGVQVFDAAQHHDHVGLDVGGRENDVVPVADDLLQIGVHVIVDEVNVGSVAKYVDELATRDIYQPN